jgi:DNA-binding NtrC family response regulator
MQPKNVLIVEDDFKLLRLYARILKTAGHNVHQAATIQAAADLLNRYEYDICISDMEIGYHKGLDVIGLYLPVLEKDTDVVIISGNDEYHTMAVDMGLHFLLKPIDNHDLIDAVENGAASAY